MATERASTSWAANSIVRVEGPFDSDMMSDGGALCLGDTLGLAQQRTRRKRSGRLDAMVLSMTDDHSCEYK